MTEITPTTAQFSSDAEDFDKQPRASLLILPREIRFLIYSYLLENKGVIKLWTNYSHGTDVNPETIHLLHVSRIIRAEIQEFFYRNQCFHFRSVEAINAFCRNNEPRHVAMIQNVELGHYLFHRNVAYFTKMVPQSLTPFESLSHTRLLGQWISRVNNECKLEVYHKVKSIADAVSGFRKGTTSFWHIAWQPIAMRHEWFKETDVDVEDACVFVERELPKTCKRKKVSLGIAPKPGETDDGNCKCRLCSKAARKRLRARRRKARN